MTSKQRFEKKEKRIKEPAHNLQFNVAQLLKQTGSSSRTYPIADTNVPSLEKEFTFSQPISGQVKFIKTDREIFVSGQLETKLVLPCTRCLEDVSMLVTFEIEETFSPTIDVVTGTQLSPDPETDEATLISDQHILDLAEVVRQALHLNQPAQVLCQPDCQGLCIDCGTNLNEETCDCEADETDSRWTGLLALKDKIS